MLSLQSRPRGELPPYSPRWALETQPLRNSPPNVFAKADRFESEQSLSAEIEAAARSGHGVMTVAVNGLEKLNIPLFENSNCAAQIARVIRLSAGDLDK